MKDKIITVILAFFSIAAITINLDPEISFFEAFNGNSVVYAFFGIAIYAISKKIYATKKVKKVSAILASLFSIMYVFGKTMNEYNNLFIFDNTKQILKLLIIIIGNFWTFYNILKYVYSLSKDNFIKQFNINKLKKVENRIFTSNITSFFIVFILIFIAWIPYLLQYYPGFVTNDSINQIYQGIGINQLNSHHPVVHTFIVSICMNLGNIIKDYNLGIAIYSILQMIIMSMIFSYSIYYMAKKKIPVKYRIIALLYCMFYQVHPLYALSMWKDVIFGGLFLLFTIMITDMICEKTQFFNYKKNYFRFIILSILVMTFRNNGFYAIIITTPFILYAYRKNIKKILVPVIISYFGYVLITGPIYSAIQVAPGSIREALSVPMQQLARTVKFHQEELTEDEKNSITQYIKIEINDIANLYNPLISDPIKNHFDGEAFSNNKMDFIKLWIKLLVKYPKDYVNAFISNCYGYWYPDATYWVSVKFTQNDPNIGISEQHIIDSSIVERYSSIIDKRNIPIISMIYSIGFCFWIIMILIGKNILENKKEYIIIFIPIIALWFTTLASPVFCEYRYVYSMFTCLPILVANTFFKEYNKEEK